MPRVVINIAIIALVALAVFALPGGGNAADGLLAVISLAFLAVIAWFVARLYRENRLTLWSLTVAHRALLYGAVAAAFATLIATPRLWETGLGLLVWLALIGAAIATVVYVWRESRRYSI
jgi:hypothetical protein